MTDIDPIYMGAQLLANMVEDALSYLLPQSRRKRRREHPMAEPVEIDGDALQLYPLLNAGARKLQSQLSREELLQQQVRAGKLLAADGDRQAALSNRARTILDDMIIRTNPAVPDGSMYLVGGNSTARVSNIGGGEAAAAEIVQAFKERSATTARCDENRELRVYFPNDALVEDPAVLRHGCAYALHLNQWGNVSAVRTTQQIFFVGNQHQLFVFHPEVRGNRQGQDEIVASGGPINEDFMDRPKYGRRCRMWWDQKLTWPRGEWDNEPDKVQWEDADTGLPCLVTREREGGSWIAWVGVEQGHPYFRIGPDACAHGCVLCTHRPRYRLQEPRLITEEEFHRGPGMFGVGWAHDKKDTDREIWWFGVPMGGRRPRLCDGAADPYEGIAVAHDTALKLAYALDLVAENGILSSTEQRENIRAERTLAAVADVSRVRAAARARNPRRL